MKRNNHFSVRGNLHHRKNHPRRPRERRLNVAQRPALSRWRFPSLPKQFQVNLRATYTDQRTGGQVDQAARVQALFEYGGTFPAMTPELFQIYRLSRIKAIGISMEVINTSSTPLTATICCLPYAIATAVVDPRNISSIPGSVTKQVGLSTGMSRAKIVKTYVGEKELGESASSGLEFAQTFAQAQAAPTQAKLPAIYSGVISTVSSATWTAVINYVYTWHVEFTEYTTGLRAVSPPETETIMSSNDSEDDVSYYRHKPARHAKKRQVQ